jgi:uncharacterized membrane protein (UPF0127 family)
MKMRAAIAVPWLLATVLYCCTPSLSASAASLTYPVIPLSIETTHGTVALHVQVATTEAQQEHGLMYRKHLARDHGMLFAFSTPQYVEFWMKGTLIPLDMLFIDTTGVITKIVARAPPLSLTPIPSDSHTVKAVLELKGGTAAYYHIAKGDKVDYSITP